MAIGTGRHGVVGDVRSTLTEWTNVMNLEKRFAIHSREWCGSIADLANSIRRH